LKGFFYETKYRAKISTSLNFSLYKILSSPKTQQENETPPSLATFVYFLLNKIYTKIKYKPSLLPVHKIEVIYFCRLENLFEGGGCAWREPLIAHEVILLIMFHIKYSDLPQEPVTFRVEIKWIPVSRN
jgi:hypothetical protein